MGITMNQQESIRPSARGSIHLTEARSAEPFLQVLVHHSPNILKDRLDKTLTMFAQGRLRKAVQPTEGNSPSPPKCQHLCICDLHNLIVSEVHHRASNCLCVPPMIPQTIQASRRLAYLSFDLRTYTNVWSKRRRKKDSLSIRHGPRSTRPRVDGLVWILWTNVGNRPVRNRQCLSVSTLHSQLQVHHITPTHPNSRNLPA